MHEEIRANSTALFFQGTNVGHQCLYIRIGEFVFVSLHFSLAVLDDVCRLSVSEPLRLGVILNAELFPHRCVAAPVFTMAGSTELAPVCSCIGCKTDSG